MVGIFVTYGLFDGFIDIFEKIKESEYGALLFLGSGTSVSYQEWAALLFLSMMAIMFLPRQFHVAVVENSDISHVSKAMWLFPLYLFLINIFVMPVAFGGLLLGGSQADADSFVLTIPLSQGKQLLTLFAFIGGFSAATSMIIVESLALSTMIMNSLVMPGIYKFNQMKGFQTTLPWLIINVKRITILGCVFLGYFFAVSIGEFYTLVDMGLKSFEAVTIFAPSIIFGLYWKKGNRNGAIAGIIAGFIIWFYTLLMPALIKSGILQNEGIFAYILNSDILNPLALFSLKGLDKWSHSLFWGLFFNVSLYVGFSIFTKQSGEDERQSLMFVDSYSPRLITFQGNYSINQIEDILGQYIGKGEAKDFVKNFIKKNNIDRESISHNEIIRLRDEAERVLSGALGSAISTIIFEDKFTLTAQERGDLSSSIKHITDTLRLSRQELAEANRNLAYLKEFSENIIESAPVGIVTIDSRLRIKYWNREMEAITDIKKTHASNKIISDLLPCIKREMLTVSKQEEIVVQTTAFQSFKVNISPFKDPSGGFVVIIENITEKMKMEQHLLQASKLASLGKLTAGISHEIGNPLASISSLIQELMSLKIDSEEHIEFTDESLNTINTHIDRIARIVRSLGDFARISSTEKVPSKISEIMERTVNLVKYDKRFRNIQLKTEIRDIQSLQVNPDKIQQVFLNIMLNAIDAMPNGGSLNIAARKSGSFVEISFRDTGAGIEETELNRIFDPFFTTKQIGKGTGLGLSICYGIIKEHGGTITVKSKKEEGAIFTIKLPVDGKG
jgi:signal transduction histidine kinase